jgi:hypothetical protein
MTVRGSCCDKSSRIYSDDLSMAIDFRRAQRALKGHKTNYKSKSHTEAVTVTIDGTRWRLLLFLDATMQTWFFELTTKIFSLLQL